MAFNLGQALLTNKKLLLLILRIWFSNLIIFLSSNSEINGRFCQNDQEIRLICSFWVLFIGFEFIQCRCVWCVQHNIEYKKTDPSTIGLAIVEIYFYTTSLVAKDKKLRFFPYKKIKMTLMSPTYLALNEFKVHVFSQGFASEYIWTDETATGAFELVTTVGKRKCKNLFFGTNCADLYTD